MSEHTPGPWKADIRTGMWAVYPASEQWNCLGFASKGDEPFIASQGGRGERSGGPDSYRLLTAEQEANARLISKAYLLPDLVEALRQITTREGAFSRDRLTHAENCIEFMAKTAEEALQRYDEASGADR